MAEGFRLNNGMTIPKIGFGTYKAADDGTSRVIDEAIRAGYRYFDTASFYENISNAELLRTMRLSKIDIRYW